MKDMLALITNKKYWYVHSLIVKFILRLRGIKVGKNFYIEGTPKLKIHGKASDISIGNNVRICGGIDLRNREQGRIVIEDDVQLDADCRLVAANQATIRVGARTRVGPRNIFNAGVDINIGCDCMLATSIVLQSSDHGIAKGKVIRTQKHNYGKISLGDDVWLGAGVVVTRGSELGNGCVVGAQSLVRKGKYEENSILVGVPVRTIRKRT